MRGGKYYFPAVTREESSKFERKSPNSKSKKTNGVERKKIRRPNIFKSDNWYKKAMLSMAISANDQR